jgi:hypothetical protein
LEREDFFDSVAEGFQFVMGVAEVDGFSFMRDSGETLTIIFSYRAATDSHDENLKAKPRRRRSGQGGTEATNRSILAHDRRRLILGKVLTALIG